MTDTWKFYLTVKINIVSTEDNREVGEMFLRSQNIVVMVGGTTKNLMNVIIRSLFSNSWENIVEKIKESDF